MVPRKQGTPLLHPSTPPPCVTPVFFFKVNSPSCFYCRRPPSVWRDISTAASARPPAPHPGTWRETVRSFMRGFTHGETDPRFWRRGLMDLCLFLYGDRYTAKEMWQIWRHENKLIPSTTQRQRKSAHSFCHPMRLQPGGGVQLPLLLSVNSIRRSLIAQKK